MTAKQGSEPTSPGTPPSSEIEHDAAFDALLAHALAPADRGLHAPAAMEGGDSRARRSARHEQAALREGQLIADRFVIRRLAGIGGMGAVYQADDVDVGRPVAVKVLVANRRASQERFVREAVVLAGLKSEAVVRYVAHGFTAAQVPFLAMEWLEGEDLSARLAHTELSVEETLALARRVCEGLSTAHDKGVTHRDLKPSNLFLVDGRADRAKILDFGIARLDAATRPLTHAGAVVGTVGYMAPEQAMGAFDIDARADVFSLGCVLFECLTGQPAFVARYDLATLAKVVREDLPKVSSLRPALGTAFDELIARLLAKDREVRPANASTVLRILDRLRWPGEVTQEVHRAQLQAAQRIGSEQRIMSVILGKPATLSARTSVDAGGKRARELDELSHLYGAEQVVMKGGATLLVLGVREGVTAADRAMQAGRCALRLRHMAPELLIGVATGTVETTAALPVGEALDRAAALVALQRAEEPSVAIDELTMALVGTRFEVRAMNGFIALLAELDGLDAPRLLMGRRTPCVGRDKELAMLEATLAECASDRVVRAVLLSAPAGVGKSRLAQEFLDRVKGRGLARVMASRADPVCAGSPMHLIQGLIRSAAALPSGDQSSEACLRLRSYVERLVPAEAVLWLSEFLGELLDLESSGAVSAPMRAARNDPEIMRAQGRRAIAAWLDAESARGTLVLLIDDVHWGDQPSLNYLEELLRGYGDRSIMLVALGRPELHDQFPRLWSAIEVHEMRVRPLTRRAAERLVRTALDVGTTPASVVDRMIELAEGNAFYLEELMRHAKQGETDFPQTIVAMVQSRLASVSAEARRILRAASVFGDKAWAAGIAALLGTSEDPKRWLDDLVLNELLSLQPQGSASADASYAFRHAFVRDAAYAMLSNADRQVAHRAAARWLEVAGERDPRIIAEHFEKGGDARDAIPWLARAAFLATERGDFATAAALAKRGLDLGAKGQDRGVLLLAVAHAGAWSERMDAVPLAEALELLPAASSQWWLALSVLIFAAKASGDETASLRYLTLASSVPPGSDLTGSTGQALQTLASASILMGRPDLGWELASRYAEVVDRQETVDAMFLSWLNLARAHLATYAPRNRVCELGSALTWGREAVEAMQSVGSISGEAVALFMMGTSLLFWGAYEEAADAFVRSYDQGTIAGNMLIRSYARLLRGWTEIRKGDVARGLAVCDGLNESPDGSIVHGLEAVRAEAMLQLGERERSLVAARHATRGPAAPYRRMAWTTLARGCVELGQAQAALHAVDAARQDGNLLPNAEFEVDLQVSKIKALLALERRADAVLTLREACEFLRIAEATTTDPRLRQSLRHGPASHRALAELQAGLGM